MSTTEPTRQADTEAAAERTVGASEATHRCPTCGEKTKRLTATTVYAMLTPSALARLDVAADGNAERYRFCASATCPTVYIREDREKVFETEQVRLPVFQKTDDPDRLVCYCFRYSAREVEQDARGDEPHIAADIRDKCRAGLARCEEENPQGSCCLGNVGKVATMAKGSSTAEAESPSVPSVSRAGGGVR